MLQLQTSLTKILIILALVLAPLMSLVHVSAIQLPNDTLLVSSSDNAMYSISPDGLSSSSLGSGMLGRFSSNGSKIVYTDLISTPAYCTGGGMQQFTDNIFTKSSNGANLKNLTPGACGATEPVWSPDDTKIAFVHIHNDGAPATIASMSADGTGFIDLGQPGFSPSWSPDGTRIVFQSSRPYGGIFVMNADGSNTVPLVEQGIAPLWSPDGTRIVFVGQSGLLTVNPDGSNVTEIPGTSSIRVPSAESMSWSPDSSKLVYLSSSNQLNILTLADGSIYSLTNSVSSMTSVSWGYPYHTPVSPGFSSSSFASIGMREKINFTVMTQGFPVPAINSEGALPEGITFTDNGDGTASINGMAGAGSNGTYPIVLTADNGDGSPAIQNFVLTVTTNPSTPAFSSPNSTIGTSGSSFNFTISTTGYPLATITKKGALPGGLTFANNGDGTATIAGTVGTGAFGVYSLTLKAQSSAGSVTQTLKLTINKTPAFMAISGNTATAGAPFSMTISTRAYPTAVITLYNTVDGLTFIDNGDGTSTLSGTPSASAAGKIQLSMNASNSLGSTDKSFYLTVNGAPTDFMSYDGAGFTPGLRSVVKPQFNGYPVPTVSLTDGTLPSTIQFDSTTGKFIGKPTANDVGTYYVTLTATNSYGSISKLYTISVSYPN